VSFEYLILFKIIPFFFRQVLTDLQQKVNYLQTNLNNQQPSGSSGPSNTDPKILNELRDTIRQIKSETNTLLQKAVRSNSDL
jgi:hypothetical protein